MDSCGDIMPYSDVPLLLSIPDFYAPRLFVVGDIHFAHGHLQEGEELIEALVLAVPGGGVDAIILLGDILDTHNVCRQSPWDQACRLIKALAAKAPTFVMMGNHDLINGSQFLTESHFFVAMKSWQNVVIVDKPTVLTIRDGSNWERSSILVPYVPPGRFREALDLCFDGVNHYEIESRACSGPTRLPFEWRTATVIFAHQEFKGMLNDGKGCVWLSHKGDEWSDGLPRVVSGHIHDSGWLEDAKGAGQGVFYTGSSRQVAINENPNKNVWVVILVDKEDADQESINLHAVPVNVRGKVEVVMDHAQVASQFDWSLLDHANVKLRIRCTPEQRKMFGKDPLYKKLINAKVSVVFQVIRDEHRNPSEAMEKMKSFRMTLAELVEAKKNSALSEALASLDL